MDSSTSTHIFHTSMGAFTKNTAIKQRTNQTKKSKSNEQILYVLLITGKIRVVAHRLHRFNQDHYVRIQFTAFHFLRFLWTQTHYLECLGNTQ